MIDAGISTGLSFAALREANRERCPLFKNAKGETAHSGADWNSEDWMVAILGELGEASNILKKIRRGDFTVEEMHDPLAREFSDTIIYLDLMAMQLGFETYKYDFAQLRLFTKKNVPPGQSLNQLMVGAFYHAGTMVGHLSLPRDNVRFEARLVTGIHWVLYYVDRLADCCGINLDEAVKRTFNMKSRQLDLPLFLTDGGPIREK
jgi:hypothetical protein